MTRLKFNLVTVCLALFICACVIAPVARPQSGPPLQIENAITQILNDMKTAFEAKDAERFMELVDKTYDGRKFFESNLRGRFSAVKSQELTLTLDSRVLASEKVTVRLHWFRRTVSNEGNIYKSHAQVQFILKRTPQELKLLEVNGDNPFF